MSRIVEDGSLLISKLNEVTIFEKIGLSWNSVTVGNVGMDFYSRKMSRKFIISPDVIPMMVGVKNGS